MEINREILEHQAYDDVLDRKEPSNPENKIYMDCYNFYWNIAGYNKYYYED